MNNRLPFLTVLASFLCVHASAVPILVGEFATADSGDATEKVAVRTTIDLYNAANNPDLPQLFGPGADPSLINGFTEFVGKTTTVAPFFSGGDDKIINWTAPNSFTSFYVLTKWGQGGANFDHALHFLTAGDTLVYNPGGGGAPQGLSHIAIWAVGPGTPGTGVPDSGSTLALLGLALIAVGLSRKHLSK